MNSWKTVILFAVLALGAIAVLRISFPAMTIRSENVTHEEWQRRIALIRTRGNALEEYWSLCVGCLGASETSDCHFCDLSLRDGQVDYIDMMMVLDRMREYQAILRAAR
jgi:hypothetical protein